MGLVIGYVLNVLCSAARAPLPMLLCRAMRQTDDAAELVLKGSAGCTHGARGAPCVSMYHAGCNVQRPFNAAMLWHGFEQVPSSCAVLLPSCDLLIVIDLCS